jgi:hypothetical protein
MNRERFVALGLARARTAWFTDVARWSTSAALPLEFVKCLSVEEARARLQGGRQFSALLADGHLAGVDRDLLDLARGQGCAVVIVEDGQVARDWTALGATTALPDDFTREDLLAVLERHARPVSDPRARLGLPHGRHPVGWRGSLLAVTGIGGAGTSTLAMAAAQGLARDVRNRGAVILADLALDADLALLHDARDLVPGLPELVEAHRGGEPSAEEVARLMFDVPERGYRLLLGLRRHRDWAGLRPRALAAALDTLQSTARLVVADVDSDVEGEEACGSIDVEERNLLARSIVTRADVVAVVGRPGPAGVHRLVRTITELVGAGLPAARVLPVVNRSPRSPRARSEISQAVAALVAPEIRDGNLWNPVFVPERRQVETAFHDATPLPEALCRPMATALTTVVEVVGSRGEDAQQGPDPVPVAAGSLGHWGEIGEP